MKNPIIIIDYFDKISPGIEPLAGNVYERAKQTYEQLTQMAKQNNVAILLKVQPNSRDLEESIKEHQAQQKLEATNEAFDHFIATGEVKPIPHISTSGGDALKYEPTLKICLSKKRPAHGKK